MIRLLRHTATLAIVLISLVWMYYFFGALLDAYRDPETVSFLWRSVGISWLYIFYYLGFMVLIGLAFAATGKWRRVRIFISYQNAHADKAEMLEEACRRRGMTPLLLPFEERSHDATVEIVQRNLRRSDLVIAIPGKDPSWMDHEISAASLVRKGVLILEHLPDQRQITTTYKGYPVFRWEKVEEDGFRKLFEFVGLSMNTVGNICIGYAGSVLGGIGLGIGAYFIILMFLVILLILGSVLAAFLWLFGWSLFGALADTYQFLKLMAFFLPIIVIVPFAVAFSVQTWGTASDIIRQRFRTGKMTAAILIRYSDRAYGLDSDVIRQMAGGEAALAAAG